MRKLSSLVLWHSSSAFPSSFLRQPRSQRPNNISTKQQAQIWAK